MTRATILSLLALAATACGESDKILPDASTPVGDTGPEVREVPDEITTDTTWTPGKPYLIPKFTHTFVRKGATLTIMPGTEVRGEKGAVLVVSRGAKIMAEGTATDPIVFTSAQEPGMRTPGYWGGVLILGYAAHNTNVATNSGEALFEAFSNADGDSGRFGKNPIGSEIADDNSGVLRYVRIEFGGYNFVADREFNNLTLCGVGRGTTIDYVQVHGGQDDGIEFFGGTVNVKHIVSSQNEDDGFDTDNGWRGKAQYVIVQNVAHRPGAVAEATNGYESDNHGTPASYRAVPRTLPTIANVTLIGDHSYTEQASWAAVFRRGTGGHYLNHIWYGFAKGPEIRDLETAEQVTAGNLTVSYSILFDNDAGPSNLPPIQASGDVDETMVFSAANHDLFAVNPGLPAAATSRTAPDFKPIAGAAALDSANAAPATEPLLADPFFDKTTFVGAIGATDWTAGWTKYPQN